MELEEAEQTAIREGRRIAESSLSMANVGKSLDSVVEWAELHGCLLTECDLPVKNYGPGGQEHIVTSQHYVMPHPERFIPTQQEIETCMKPFGFEEETPTTWVRQDGISCGDVHDRNLIRRPDGEIEVIDVQPILPKVVMGKMLLLES